MSFGFEGERASDVRSLPLAAARELVRERFPCIRWGSDPTVREAASSTRRPSLLDTAIRARGSASGSANELADRHPSG
jgi:hypothetical protein